MFDITSVGESPFEHVTKACHAQRCIEVCVSNVAAITGNVAVVYEGVDKRARTTDVGLGGRAIVPFMKWWGPFLGV